MLPDTGYSAGDSPCGVPQGCKWITWPISPRTTNGAPALCRNRHGLSGESSCADWGSSWIKMSPVNQNIRICGQTTGCMMRIRLPLDWDRNSGGGGNLKPLPRRTYLRLEDVGLSLKLRAKLNRCTNLPSCLTRWVLCTRTTGTTTR